MVSWTLLCASHLSKWIVFWNIITSVIGGHMGMTKTLKTLSTRYFCPRMADYIRAYIVGCSSVPAFQEFQKISQTIHEKDNMTYLKLDL